LKIGTDFANQGANIGFGKNDDGVHGGKSCENLGAFRVWHYRAALTFQRSHRGVGIYRNHKASAEFFGGLQVANVANVQHVEAAVREGDAITGAAPFLCALAERRARQDLRLG
jgi:hypothetical protein